MNHGKIVIGIGNIYKNGDDFGVQVVKKLKMEKLPEDVTVVDGGIGGLNLLSFMVAAKEKVIFVDSLEFKGKVGDLLVTDIEKIKPKASNGSRFFHSSDLYEMYSLASKLNPNLKEVKLVGAKTNCKNADSMSPVVEKALAIIKSEIGAKVA
jgi:hydrogenase maturation protease